MVSLQSAIAVCLYCVLMPKTLARKGMDHDGDALELPDHARRRLSNLRYRKVSNRCSAISSYLEVRSTFVSTFLVVVLRRGVGCGGAATSSATRAVYDSRSLAVVRRRKGATLLRCARARRAA